MLETHACLAASGGLRFPGPRRGTPCLGTPIHTQHNTRTGACASRLACRSCDVKARAASNPGIEVTVEGYDEYWWPPQTREHLMELLVTQVEARPASALRLRHGCGWRAAQAGRLAAGTGWAALPWLGRRGWAGGRATPLEHAHTSFRARPPPRLPGAPACRAPSLCTWTPPACSGTPPVWSRPLSAPPTTTTWCCWWGTTRATQAAPAPGSSRTAGEAAGVCVCVCVWHG